MSDLQAGPELPEKGRSKAEGAGLWLFGLIGFLIVGMYLEDTFGLPFGFSVRLASIAFCQWCFWRLRSDYPDDWWSKSVFWSALVLNILVLLSPLTDRQPSRGELMVFALPDAILFLAVRTVTYKVADVHQRAVRQQLVLGLILALAFYGVILTVMLLDPAARHWGLHWNLKR